VPLLPAAGTTFTPLALSEEPFDSYSVAWAVLGEAEALPTQRARLAVRLLGSSARCALTALPTSGENDATAAQLVQDTKAAVEILLAQDLPEDEFTSKAAAVEVLPVLLRAIALRSLVFWARQPWDVRSGTTASRSPPQAPSSHPVVLMHQADLQAQGLRRAQAAALLAARVALPRSDLTALLPRAARLAATSSPLAVRHALAVLCRIPSTKLKGALGPLLPPLRAAFEAYAADGLMHEEPPPPPGQPPTPGVLPLGDWLARVYLARLLAKLIFSGSSSGGTKTLLWKVLSRLAFSKSERAQVCSSFSPHCAAYIASPRRGINDVDAAQ
jgi:hypothetical protein